MAAPADADVWMFLGTNPLVSLWAGMGIANPGAELRRIRHALRPLEIVVVNTAAGAKYALHHRPFWLGSTDHVIQYAVHDILLKNTEVAIME